MSVDYTNFQMMNSLPFSDIRHMNLPPSVAMDDNSLVPDGASV